MRVWSDWGFTSDWWRGLRGEYWVIAQGILLLGFIILPTDTPSFIDLEISAWQYIRWILTAIFGIGAVIILGQALIDLGRNLTPLPHPKDDGELVQTGIYSVVRHPIYAGVIGLAFAYGFWQMSWLHGLGAIAMIVFFDLKARKEEIWLMEKFSDYENYRISVKKLIPWIYWRFEFFVM